MVGLLGTSAAGCSHTRQPRLVIHIALGHRENFVSGVRMEFLKVHFETEPHLPKEAVALAMDRSGNILNPISLPFKTRQYFEAGIFDQLTGLGRNKAIFWSLSQYQVSACFERLKPLAWPLVLEAGSWILSCKNKRVLDDVTNCFQG